MLGGCRKLILVCLLCLMVSHAVFATQASERESQSVEMKFYQMSESEWTATQASFKSIVSQEADSYCSSNMETCGLDPSSGHIFTSLEIGLNSGPTIDSKSLVIEVYIDFPTVHQVSNTSSTQYVVNSAAVKTILTNKLDEIENSLGHDVTSIGDEFYGIDPDAKMNEILIPIAFLVLFGIIILAVALHMWNKKREQAEKKQKMIQEREKRKKGGRIMPMATMVPDSKQQHSFWPKRSRKKKALKTASFGEDKRNGDIPTLSMKTNMMTYDSTPAAVPEQTKMDTVNETVSASYEERVSLRNNVLPPLPNPASEEERTREEEERQRDKKERRRRRKERRQREGGQDGVEESESEKSKSEMHEVPVE